MNYNKVQIAGNLTRDPELRYTPKGTAVCKVGMAINRTWSNEAGEKKEDVTFVDVDIFGLVAENVGQYMRKGSSMFVEGRLKLDSWDDKAAGQKKTRLGVVAENVQFIGKKDPKQSQNPSSKVSAGEPPIQKSEHAGAVGGDDDVPF